MAGVGPGTAIAGRYALRTIAHRAPRGQRWVALDLETGMPVSVLLVPESQPVASAVLDAGRRASVLEDQHIVRVLDAGTDHGYAYVVEELDDDTHTLHDLLSDGPLAPEEARRLTGETAMVVERARQRGVHHEALTPAHLAVRRDGSIRLRGLAVDAALADSAAADGRHASAADAAGLAGLLHAGLTATWPLTGSTLTPSPRVGRSVVPPSELAAAVPADLDDTVRAGLEGHAEIPGDIAERLTPWSDTPVGRVVEAGPAADTEAPRSERPVAPELLPDELRGDIEHPPSKAAVAVAAGASAVASVAAAGGRRSAEAAKAAAARAAALTAERRRDTLERREAEKESERSFNQIATERPAEPERVVPVLAPTVTTAVPSARQAKFVLSLMATLVAVALLAGILGVVSMVNNINRKVALGAGPAPTRTVTAPAVTVTAKPGGGVIAPVPKPAPSSAGVDLPVLAATSYDPGGDGTEHPEWVARVTDHDPASTWKSQQYDSPTFGAKGGVGLRFDLGQKAAVRTVTLTTPDTAAGEQLTVYVGDEPSPTKVDGMTVLGKATVAGTETTVTTQTPGEHQYLFVWFTQGAPTGARYMASLSEIKLSS